MSTPSEKRKVTPPENRKPKTTPPKLARRWGVGNDKVIFLIRTGELRAIDCSMKRGERPRYLIDEEDIEAFEQARQVVPDVKPQRRKRPSRPDSFVRNFR